MESKFLEPGPPGCLLMVGFALKILDLDMDYFMDNLATFVPASYEERLDE